MFPKTQKKSYRYKSRSRTKRMVTFKDRNYQNYEFEDGTEYSASVKGDLLMQIYLDTFSRGTQRDSALLEPLKTLDKVQKKIEYLKQGRKPPGQRITNHYAIYIHFGSKVPKFYKKYITADTPQAIYIRDIELGKDNSIIVLHEKDSDTIHEWTSLYRDENLFDVPVSSQFFGLPEDIQHKIAQCWSEKKDSIDMTRKPITEVYYGEKKYNILSGIMDDIGRYDDITRTMVLTPKMFKKEGCLKTM